MKQHSRIVYLSRACQFARPQVTGTRLQIVSGALAVAHALRRLDGNAAPAWWLAPVAHGTDVRGFACLGAFVIHHGSPAPLLAGGKRSAHLGPAFQTLDLAQC